MESSLKDYLEKWVQTKVGKRKFPGICIANLNKKIMEGFYARWDAVQTEEEKDEFFEDLWEYLENRIEDN